MIVNNKITGGMPQGLAWLHRMWQNSSCANLWVTAQTEDDYYHSVPIEIMPGVSREEFTLFLNGLNLSSISVGRKNEHFSYIPGEKLVTASAENDEMLRQAQWLPPRALLVGWAAEPQLLSFGTASEIRLEKVLAFLDQEPLFAGASRRVHYHRTRSMTDYTGNPEKVISLMALHPGNRVMLGYDRMHHYLVIWGPDTLQVPDLDFFTTP